MDLSFSALQPDYQARLAAVKMLRPVGAKAEAERLLPSKTRFLALQASSKVPALWVMPAFYRESPSFATYLGNGDPLNRPTTDVPAGRGPFATWEEGALDALHYDKITEWNLPWTWEAACFLWEKWNGFGYRQYHGIPTPYLWAGSDQYHYGKYGSDGKFDPTLVDEQLGTVILAKAIAELDPELAGFASLDA